MSLSEIAQRVGLPRSTVHRIVTALVEEGLLTNSWPNGGFRLGLGLASLATAAREELMLELHPDLVRLAEAVNETVDLAVLDGGRVLFVDQVAVPRRLVAVSAVGMSFPLHCTANGKALLAALDDRRVERLLPRQLDRLTPKTITSRSALLEEIAQVRRDGAAFDREEHTLGICAVGAVVRNRIGTLAAVTIPLPASRFYGNERSLVESLLRACHAMSRAVAAR
jgi:DNA-binding IclR family transcriptional regulator